MPSEPTRIGASVFLCRRRGPGSRGGETCRFCPGEMVALCDYRKPGARRRCSARLCETHRISQGPDLDACPDHAVAIAEPLGPLLHVAPAAPAPTLFEQNQDGPEGLNLAGGLHESRNSAKLDG